MRCIMRSGNVIDIDDIKFRTGDILLFRWNYTIGDVDKNLKFTPNRRLGMMDAFVGLGTYAQNMRYVHIGIVVIHNDRPYLLELNVLPMYCNYDGAVLVNKPTLTGLDGIRQYYGLVVHLPYTGDELPQYVIDRTLREKNNYMHARHSSAALARNILQYSYGDTTDTTTINCLQYIIIVLEKFNINHMPLNTLPNDIYLNLAHDKNYGSPNIIRNRYVDTHY